MNLAILGASGGCGTQLMQQAVAARHAVTAIVRPSSTLNPPEGVHVERGDINDLSFLSGAIGGADAVLSALGLRLPGLAPWARPEIPDLLSRSTPVLVEAMRKTGVRRLIAISAGGVGDSYMKVPAMFRFFINATALRHAYAELEAMEKILLASDLEVCICRPTGLTDGPLTRTVKVCSSFQGRATISRADVAAWMLEEVARPHFAEKTPMISVTGV